ncbi:MAG: hypothetical protein HYY16_12650 [Planctomycetes bacterium]|nr:hypothetical protein [Planctomycetota bacterium]
MAKDKLGSGWDRDADGKKYVSVAIDLGALGELSCAVFENTKRDASRNQPTHNLVYSPEQGKTKYVGAFWKKEGKQGGEYLMGRIALKELGTILVGGVSVDFSKVELPIDAKICRAANENGKGPNYHVFRVAPVAKSSAVTEAE